MPGIKKTPLGGYILKNRLSPLYETYRIRVDLHIAHVMYNQCITSTYEMQHQHDIPVHACVLCGGEHMMVC